jgi:predicted tellurium resistance membrane protein TerC
MNINIKKHLGIVLIILGVLLTMDKTDEFNGIVNTIAYYFREFWPMVLLFIGIYFLSNPKKSKK